MSLKNKQLTKREFIKTLGIFGILFSLGGLTSLFTGNKSTDKQKSGYGSSSYGA